MFGTRPTNMKMNCDYQPPNVTIKIMKSSSESRVNVPADIVPGNEEEYCYSVVLGDVQGKAINGIHADYIIADYQYPIILLFSF